MPEEKYTIKHPLIKVFFTAFFLFLISVSPILIMSKGVYLWEGDYNVQTIVFIERMHRMLHSGNGLPAFDWGSMLGMDFFTSYHDHLFSPFDWLLYALPYSAVPYAHSAVAAIKVGLAAVTAYVYCRQFVKKDRSAFICGMLYAFSGFQLFNLVYQFGDRYLMFPLLLYSFDQLVINKRPFCFAALLGLNCLISPYFAWMICLFMLIYYIVRTATKSYPRLDLKLFLRLAVETGFGVLSGAVVMLPFYLLISDNTRANNSIFGHSLIVYENLGVVLSIIKSMFFPPAICANDWYFRDVQLSISPPQLFIPVFFVLGVWIIFRKENKAWYSVLLKVCAVIACVPVLNSAFSMFNNNYYARWMFMPLLIMIMMTGRYVDIIEEMRPKIEVITCSAILVFWGLYGIYSVFAEYPTIVGTELWIIHAVLILPEIIVLFMIHFPHKELKFISADNLKRIVCVFCMLPFLVTSYFMIESDGFEHIDHEVGIIWNNFNPVKIDDDEFFRTTSGMSDKLNRGMMWDYPTLEHFNSMITGDTCNFFDTAGNRCTQALTLAKDDYALSSFLSVKYDIFYNLPLVGGIEVDPKDLKNRIEGFEQYDVIDPSIIYRNKAYIPIGFTYDHYLTIPEPAVGSGALTMTSMNQADKDYINTSKLPETKEDRHKLLLKAIWLNEDQVEKYSDILTELPDEKREDVSLETYYQDCKDRAATACYEFVPDGKGFNARIDLPKENLVFFSVPYSKYFTAYVDDQPVEIERVFNGLSAVLVPEGDHAVSFRYEIPGFKTGLAVSIASFSVIIVYTVIDLILKRRTAKNGKKTEA